jgi:hypothetical protein
MTAQSLFLDRTEDAKVLDVSGKGKIQVLLVTNVEERSRLVTKQK